MYKSFKMFCDSSAFAADASSLPDVESVEQEITEIENEMDEVERETPPEGAKKSIKKKTEEEVTAKAEIVMPRLLSLTDYNTEDCAKDFVFLKKYAAHSTNNARRVRYFDKLADLELTALFERVWTTHFTDPFTEKSELKLWNNMKSILLVMWNGTDRSKKLCQAVINNKTYLPIIKWLKDPKISAEKAASIRVSYTIKGFFGIIHNSLAHLDETRQLCREAGIVQALKPFLE